MIKMIVAFLILTVFGVTSVSAQEFDFKKASQDYVFNYDLYRSAHDEYELARGQYLQSKTLASQAKAQEATYKMLQARDEAMKTYLTMLRLRLGEAVGVSFDDRELLYTRLDAEVSWYDGHKNALSSAATLEDQVADSNVAKDRFTKTTEVLIYDGLTKVATGKAYFLRQKQNSIIAELDTKLAEIRANNDLQTDAIERWVLEVQNRQTRSVSKEAEVASLFLGMEKSKNRDNLFNQIQFRLGESVQYLKEANNYLKEIIGKIKNG